MATKAIDIHLKDQLPEIEFNVEITDKEFGSQTNSLAGKEVFTAGATGIVAYESVYAGQDDEGNPEFERFMWFNENGKLAFETFTLKNACGKSIKEK